MPSDFCTLLPTPKSPWTPGTFKVAAVSSLLLVWPLTYPDSFIQIPKFHFAASDKIHSFPFHFQIMMDVLLGQIFVRQICMTLSVQLVLFWVQSPLETPVRKRWFQMTENRWWFAREQTNRHYCLFCLDNQSFILIFPLVLTLVGTWNDIALLLGFSKAVLGVCAERALWFIHSRVRPWASAQLNSISCAIISAKAKIRSYRGYTCKGGTFLLYFMEGLPIYSVLLSHWRVTYICSKN